MASSCLLTATTPVLDFIWHCTTKDTIAVEQSGRAVTGPGNKEGYKG